MTFLKLAIVQFFLVSSGLVYGVLQVMSLEDRATMSIELDANLDATSDVISELLEDILLAQKAERGFIITSDEKHIESYHQARASIPVLLAKLDRLAVEIDQFGLSHDWLHEALSETKNDWAVLDKNHQTVLVLFQQGKTAEMAALLNLGVSFDLLNGMTARIHRLRVELSNQKAKNDLVAHGFLSSISRLFQLLLVFVLVSSVVLLYLYRKMVGRPLRRISKWLKLDKSTVGLNNFPHTGLILEPAVEDVAEALFSYQSELSTLHEDRVHLIEKQLKEQSEYSAVLAHEVRTPLNTLIGLISLGKANGMFESDPHTFQLMQQSSDNLMTLVNSALDYQRLREGKYVLEANPIDVGGFTKSLVGSAKIQPNAKRLVIESENHIPSDVLLVTDSPKVRQILTNLLSNAIKFTPGSGRVKLTTELEIVDGKTFWVLSVADTGLGLSQTGIDRLFKPFSQADTGANRKFGGTGLGLALSQEIAHALGGEITVKSQQRVGSEFTLKIPVKTIKNEGQLDGCTFGTIELNNTLLDLTGKTVLMIEDHGLNAKINSTLLKRQTGCDVIWFDTAEAAILRIKQGQTSDLILMDVNLGEGMTGLEASQYLINLLQDKCPPIIALTAGVLESERQKVFESGMSGFLSKPFNEKGVRKVLGQFFPECLKPIKNEPNKLDAQQSEDPQLG